MDDETTEDRSMVYGVDLDWNARGCVLVSAPVVKETAKGVFLAERTIGIGSARRLSKKYDRIPYTPAEAIRLKREEVTRALECARRQLAFQESRARALDELAASIEPDPEPRP